MTTPQPAERPITEAEYRAWLEKRAPEIAGELTDLLPQAARDAGLRFEWAAPAPAEPVTLIHLPDGSGAVGQHPG